MTALREKEPVIDGTSVYSHLCRVVRDAVVHYNMLHTFERSTFASAGVGELMC